MVRNMGMVEVIGVLQVSLPAWLALSAAWLGGWRMRGIAFPRGEHWLAGCALLAGVSLGVALLATGPHLAEFAPGRIFAPDAIWNAGLGELLLRDGLPGRLAVERLGAALVADGGRMAVALGCLAALAVLPGHWRHGRRLSLGRAAAVFALLVLAGALATHQAGLLGAWALHRLGFWTFLLVLVVFQQWRQRRRFARLAAALVSVQPPRLTPG